MYIFLQRLAFCLAAIFLSASCQNDDIIEPSTSTLSSGSVRKIDFNEFKTDKAAFNKISKYLDARPGIIGKGVYNEDYEFTVDTDRILLSEKDNYKFYTFDVYPDEEKGLVEKLYLHPQSDSTYLAFLIKYKFSDVEMEGLRNGDLPFKLEDKALFYSLDDFNPSSVMKGTGVSFVGTCTFQVSVTAIPKAEGEVVGCDSPSCLYDFVYSYSLVSCNYVISNNFSGDEPPPAGSGSPKGGNPFNPDQNININPVMSLSVQDDIAHIRELNKITRTTSAMRPIIDQYRTHLDSPMHEEGVEFRFDNNSYSSFPAISQLSHAVKFAPAVMTSLIRIHKHDLNTDPIFSMGDIFATAEFYKQKDALNAPDKANITSVMVSKKGVYALRVVNESELLEFYDRLNQKAILRREVVTIADFLDALCEQEVIDKALADSNGNPDMYDNLLHQYFIKFFRKLGCGQALFYAPHTPNGTYTWTKISQ